MTILEVLTHDPLYNWSMTLEKAYRLQYGKEPDAKTKANWEKQKRESNGDMPNAAGDSGNKMAERILDRVEQKLNGLEDGHFMSVNGQANALIQQARDPARLCALFAGWQPYL